MPAPGSIIVASNDLGHEAEIQRVIGRHGEPGGPTVVITAGLHGNEPSGVFAARQVLGRLQADGIRLQGQFIALAGNMGALERNVRQIDRDLNRVWTGPEMERLLADPDNAWRDSAEAAEAVALHREIMAILDSGAGPFYFLDLHTTSSDSVPFVPFDDTLKNRDFAAHFPVTGVLGIEEFLPGTLLSYLTRFNVVTLGYEAGQHEDPASIRSHEALLWLALHHAGILPAESGIDVAAERDYLLRRTGSLSGFYDVRFRYGIAADEQFRMKPGFRNFAPVRRGQHLADNQVGPIRSQLSGNILMPLYQSAGSDGYFLVRRVWKFWLTLSRFLRRRHFERWLALLPGVRIVPGDTDTLEVDTRVARFLATELFHLLGYRRSRVEGRIIRFSRREI